MRGKPTRMQLPGGLTAAVALVPAGSEFSKIDTHSDSESTSLSQSRHSPRLLVERHEQSMACVCGFMGEKDGRKEAQKADKPIEGTMSVIFCHSSQGQYVVPEVS